MDRFLIGGQSEVLVGDGLVDPLLPERDGRQRVVVLRQAAAAPAARSVVSALEGHDTAVVDLLDGEAAKDVAALAPVYAQLAAHRLGRDDTIVVVGGGAATDVGGFIGATWLRGVEVVYVPTTVLGAVDAAIGGKTAVNVAGKNLVGVFRHPSRVVVSLDELRALPAELKRQGAAEALKAGLLARPSIVDSYLRHGVDAPLEDVIVPAIAFKAEVVDADFREEGQRALLNLGHTIGHAIEFASGLSHGEAVAIGLVAAVAVSERRLGFGERGLVEAALERLELPLVSPPVDRAQVMDLVGLDKKRDDQGLRMVLLEEIGSPRLVHVDAADIAHGLAAIGL